VVLAGRAACSHIIRLHNDSDLCARTFAQFLSRIVRLASTIEPTCIIFDAELEREVERIWATQVNRPSEQRTFAKCRLREICESSVLRRLQRPPESSLREADYQFQKVENDYQKDTIRHLIYYRRIWENRPPAAVVHFGGHFHQDRAAFLVCRELSIPCVAIESSFIPNQLYFDPAGVTGHTGAMSKVDPAHYAQPVSEEQRNSIDGLLQESLDVDAPRIGRRPMERDAIRARLGVAPLDRVALFLAQVPYDSAVIADGGDFRNQLDTIENLVASLWPSNEWRLLVRAHPKDDTGLVEKRSSKLWKEKGWLIVDAQSVRSLYEQIIASDVAITVNSQAALQAAWLGVPVLVLGRASYSAKGFTIDIAGQGPSLGTGLEMLLRRRQKDERHAVMSYLGRMITKYLVQIRDVDNAASRVIRLAELSNER
jgi:hypothetical protein